jgi:hypothetical protein
VAYGLVVVMLELLIYALVMSPLVPPMMRDAHSKLVPMCYDTEMPKAMEQPVRYLVYTIGWYYQGILQGNAFLLQWGCLSHGPHSLI